MKGVLKKAAGALVSGRKGSLADHLVAVLNRRFPIRSAGMLICGNGDVQFIRRYSVDDVGDVAVFNYRGAAVLHVVLQVVLHPLLSPKRVWIYQINGAVINDLEVRLKAPHRAPSSSFATVHLG